MGQSGYYEMNPELDKFMASKFLSGQEPAPAKPKKEKKPAKSKSEPSPEDDEGLDEDEKNAYKPTKEEVLRAAEDISIVDSWTMPVRFPPPATFTTYDTEITKRYVLKYKKQLLLMEFKKSLE